MSHVYAVGIDLGTTNSVVAYVTDAGRTAMLANELGDYITPSVVYFDDEETLVGRAAQKAGLFHPENVALEAKRELGQSRHAQRVRGERLPPEVIQGCVLAHLKSLLDEKLDGDYRVVITVPAFFDQQRRKAVEDSAQVAGLDVLDIINEPTSAALAYAEHHGYLSAADRGNDGNKNPLNLLVYDLGGGTFDVTVIRLEQGKTRTLATDGDVRLGGSDWDRRLADYFAQKFEAQHRLDPRDDPVTQARLMQLAEETKQTLSARKKAVVCVEYLQHKMDLELTQDQFEILTADFLERTGHTTKETLAASGLSARQIDKIVLAGGATRMPMVAKMLESLLDRVPDQTLNPDESVARGAAIYAAQLLREAGIKTPALNCQIVDVNSHSLGIEGVDPLTGKRQHTILIPRNTPLPTSALHKFVTKRANQETISIKVLEGESLDPSACILIGRAAMRDVPPGLPKGTHLEVIYQYLANGRLTVLIRIPDPDGHGPPLQEMTVELQREGNLSDDRIRAWQSAVQSGGGFTPLSKVVKEVLGVTLPQEEDHG
jgi:molecular chaperone DnaK